MHTMCGLRTGKNSQKNRQEANNEKMSSAKNLERYIGDGLTLRLGSNEKDIEITGDGCRLTVSSNRGKIRINGDGCRLRIEKNSGDIEYRGDGGRVSLGPDSTGTKVQYFGEGGRVNIATSNTNTRNKSSASGAAVDKKNNPKDLDDYVQCTDIVDNIVTDKRPTRILRTTSKTVRVVYGNPKIISPTRKQNSVAVSKGCTVTV